MAKIKTLRDSGGGKVYPITSATAVIAPDGSKLSDYFDAELDKAAAVNEGTPTSTDTNTRWGKFNAAEATRSQSAERAEEAAENAEGNAEICKSKIVEVRDAMTRLTDGQAVSAQVALNTADIQALNNKTEKITKNNTIDDDDCVTITDGSNNVVAKIDQSGANFKNLKSNGASVITSADISSKADKTYVDAELEKKQTKIDKLSTANTVDETEEQIWASDNGSDEYVKISSAGIKAKKYMNLDGSDLQAKDFLCGKKWAVFGDSFTDGATQSTFDSGKYSGKQKTYPYFIGNRTGIEVLKYFASGKTLAYPSDESFTNCITAPSNAMYYQNVPADVDYITFYIGINDSHHRSAQSAGDGESNQGIIPIGTITENTTSTYYGAWNVVLTWLKTNRPFAHVGIIVSNGCDTVDYQNAQIAIARKYGIPYIDLNGDDRTPVMLRSTNADIPSAIKTVIAQKQAVDYDGSETGSVNLHPNDDAQSYESIFIENFLRTI